ncbi:hypothetical protein ACVW00_002186 [Marmoricola sp. URHA0025 HA25]
MKHPGPRRAAAGRLVALLATGALVLVWSGTSGTQSSWTSAQVANSANSALASTLSFAHAYPSGASSCSLTGPASTTTCTGTIWATSAASTSVATKSDTITDSSGAPTGTAMYSQGEVVSCRPVQLANAKTATDPLLPRYATTFRQTDPWGTTSAVSLSGGTAYAGEVVQTNTGTVLGSNFSIGVWFKVASGYATGGALIGLDVSANSTASIAGDPQVWMDPTGHIRFRVAATTPMSGVSTSTYADGGWHLATLTISSAVVSTSTLYVDSTSVASSGGIALLTGNTGYWHVGWGDFTSIANAPTTPGLTGSLSGAFVTANALTGAQVTALRSSASASAYQTTTTGYTGAKHVWMLGDSGITTFATSISWVTGGDPCTMVTLAWTLGGSSVFATTTLRALVTSAWLPVTPVAAPTPGNTQASVTSFARVASGYDADVAGLHLYAPLAYRVGLVSPPSSGWSLTFTWSGDPSGVFLA